MPIMGHNPRGAVPILELESKGCCVDFRFKIQLVLCQFYDRNPRVAVPILGYESKGCYANFRFKIQLVLCQF